MKQRQRLSSASFVILVLTAAALIAAPAWGEPTAGKPDIKELYGLDGIEWQTKGQYQAANLVVTGPDGFRIERAFEAGDSLFLDFAEIGRAASPSGRYRYELTISPLLNKADRALAADARALGEDASFLAPAAFPALSGAFTLLDGNAVDRDLPEVTLKPFFHIGSGSIDGSLCVGLDCVSSEAFGFDTVRLKENNLRLHFDDTSSTASFPDNDWRLTANDSSNGGDEYFAIEDASAGRFVFRVFAGARSNALVVDSQGDVGVGTATPALDIHVKTGDTPSLRLEQDGTSGFTPQTWDVAGNETGFFIRDATSGSTLPFRILTGGAPSQSLVIDGDGDVGIGAGTNPDSKLDIDAGAGTVALTLGGNAGISFKLDANDDGSDFWQVTSTNNDAILRFNRTGGSTELEVDENGDLSIGGDCIQIGANFCTVSGASLSCAAGTCP